MKKIYYNNPYYYFIEDLKKKCKKYNCTIDIRKNVQYIKCNGKKCSGYFDSKSKIIRIIDFFKDSKKNNKILILIHESCHLDQFIENSKVWKDSFIRSEDTGVMFDDWLSGKRKFSKSKLSKIVRKIYDLELDCEKRTIAKIKKYKLPHNILDYIQNANSYILLYYISMHLCKWFKNAPYSKYQIWKKMPKRFITNPEKVYLKYLDLYKKYCF